MGIYGAVEFSEFGFDDFRICSYVEVIFRRAVGDVPGCVKDGFSCMLAGLAETHNSTP